MRPVTFVLLGVRSAAVANPISLWVAGAFMLPHTDSYPYLKFTFVVFSQDFRSIFVHAFCVSIHRNADAALGVDLQVRVHFTWHNILEMLARRLGQAMVVWRNTPACGVAETYIFLCCFVASGGPMKHIISS